MSGQLDKGREFLGLETAAPIGTPDIDVTDVVTETTVPDTTTTTTVPDTNFSDEMLVDLGIDPKSDPSTWMEQGTTTIKPKPDMSTWDKIVDKGEKGYNIFKTGQEVAQTFADDEYDIGTGWNNYVADNMVGYYESANVDWIGQGMAGQSHYGMGNDNFFRSVYNLGQNNPDLWFLDMGVVKR